MFCPNCGRKNQKGTSFCRSCGEDLPKLKEKVKKGDFRKQIKKINIANFILMAICTLFCTLMAIYLIDVDLIKGDFLTLTFLGLSVAFIISLALSAYSNYYLKKTTLGTQNEKGQKTISADTKELLPEADFSNNVPPSVVENTTKDLREKVLRNKVDY